MENMAKTSILLMVALLIATVVSTGSVLAAQTCQDECSVYTKFEDITIGIWPDANEQWPVVVNEAGSYRCDDPLAPNPDNYPCLAWPYKCVEGPCEKITKVNILIPNCCDKPINILYTSKGAPVITTCDQPQSEFPNVCSGYELQLENISGANPPPEGSFWFTTPKGIGTNMIDFTFPIQSKPTTCLTGIKGPGCNTQIPPVRVEPRVQCYQFTADTDNCQKAQTWYAEWAGTDPCAVDVWVADAVDGIVVPCDEVKILANKLTGEALGDIKIDVGGGVYQPLTEALTNNSQCSEGWLRFTDLATGCNVRCYYSGGRRYCR